MAGQNEILQQVIETIRKDIVSDKKFLGEILQKIELNTKNIPPDLILQIMNQLSTRNDIRKPVSNAPKDIKTRVAKPISVGADSIESKVVSDLLGGNNVYLMGKAGTGKTYLAKAIAENVMGQPTFIINCSQWTSPVEIRGGQTIKGYEEGQLIKAWAQGGILILDELPKLDPNTAGLLNDALAETSAQPKYDEKGKVIPESIPYIINGKGDKIYKGQDVKDENLKFRFCVIGTGNTDMITVGNKYGGNQRQDYSLVDRFAGSFYVIDNDPVKEMSLTYPYVFRVCDAIREFLNTVDVVQSISLRTMLNFNRTFEQEMLYKMESKFADEIFGNTGSVIPPKTIQDSIDSFLNMMDEKTRRDLQVFPAFVNATSEQAKSEAENKFATHFMLKYELNPRTGEPLTDKELEELKKM